MHVENVEIRAINGIRELSLKFDGQDSSGWHVLIGDNGSGKTTVLRSIAIGMMSHAEFLASRGKGVTPNFDLKAETFLRECFIELKLRFHKDFDQIRQLRFTSSWEEAPSIDPRTLESMWSMISFSTDKDHGWRGRFVESQQESGSPEKYYAALIFNGQYKGLFACGYGPYRRLSTGLDHPNNPRANAFWTLFSEEAGLQQTTRWLEDLKLDSRHDPSKKETLAFVIEFINATGFLPSGARLTDHIDSNGIKLVVPEGTEIYFKEASDGYRSILGVALDLLKNMIACYGLEAVVTHSDGFKIDLPGVVLIDEVDAHLHPNWQARIGKWFTDFFPQIQFIVTTHSPFICRGCGEKGQIWRLTRSGSEVAGMLLGENEREELVYGDILAGSSAQGFGIDLAPKAGR